MAIPAVNLRTLANIDGILILQGKTSVCGGLGNHGSVTGKTVAGLAFLTGIFKETLVAIDPPLAVHVVHAMGTVQGTGQAGSVAGGTLYNHAVVALDGGCRKIVVGFAAGPNGVGTAVARLAGYPVMPDAVSIEGAGLFRKPLVGGDNKGGHIGAVRVGGPTDYLVAEIADGISGMTRFAPGHVTPGLAAFTADCIEVSMAVDTIDPGRIHGPPGALRFLARVTIKTDIAAGRRCQDTGCMKTVHGW